MVKEVVDLRTVGGNVDDVTFNLSIGIVEGKNLEERFRATIEKIRTIVTEGGTTLNNIPVSYADHRNPCFLFTIVAREGEADMTTFFIMKKVSLYLEAFAVHRDHWILFKNSTIKLINGVHQPIDSTLDMRYGSPTDKDGLVPQSCKHLIGRVGRFILLKALSGLRSEQLLEQQYAFYSVCHHIAESCRFSNIESLVTNCMRDYGTRPYENEEMLYIQNWSQISSVVRNKVLVPEKLNLDVFKLFEDPPEKVIENVKVLLCERDDAREARRKDIWLKYKSSSGRHLVACTGIKKRLLKLKRNEVREDRATVVNSLMLGGGYPDIWRCLVRAVGCLETRNGYISLCIIQNTDVRFTVPKPNLELSVDDKGFEYAISDKSFVVLTN